MIATRDTSESDRTAAVRDTASGTKNRTITETIKGLFRAARNALTRRDEAEPPPPRRRRGETEGDFRKLGRKLAVSAKAAAAGVARGRYAALQPTKPPVPAVASGTAAIPAEFLSADPDWNAFDITNPWYDPGFESDADFDSGFDAQSHHIAPQL